MFAALLYAQKSGMRECRVGVSIRLVPSYLCDAMLEAFPLISFEPNNQVKWMNSLRECNRIMSATLTENRPGQIDSMCLRIWQDNEAHVYDDAMGRHYH